MNLISHFKDLTAALAVGIELLAAGIIGLAVVEATIRTARVFLHPDLPQTAKEILRLRLAHWLAIALEFELGADILRTAIAPTWSEIGMLAAIAAIRTGLNYFLDLEIQRAATSESARSEFALTTRGQPGAIDAVHASGSNSASPPPTNEPRAGDPAAT